METCSLLGVTVTGGQGFEPSIKSRWSWPRKKRHKLGFPIEEISDGEFEVEKMMGIL